MESVSRLARFQALLQEQRLPLALVCDPFNVCYLTGYWTILSGIPGTEQVLAVPGEGRPWLAVPGLEETLARAQCPNLGDIRYLRPGETLVNGDRRPAQSVSQLVRLALEALPQGASVGVDASPLRSDRYRVLEESLGGRQVIDLAPHFAATSARARTCSYTELATASGAIFNSRRPKFSRSG